MYSLGRWLGSSRALGGALGRASAARSGHSTRRIAFSIASSKPSSWGVAVGSALVAAVAGGIVVEYACGVAGLMAMARMSLTQALLATAVFVPGDLLKALATAFVAEASYRGYPAAIASRA